MKNEVTMANIEVSNIYAGDRVREKYPDIDELIQSIRDNGLIQPIAVFDKNFVDNEEGIADDFLESDKDYLLLGGGRRIVAYKKGRISDTIPARIYDEVLTGDQLKEIELFENLDRVGLTYKEEVTLKKKIHDLQTKIHGKAVKGAQNGDGHSVEDTAQMLGESKATTSQDIKLAEAMEKLPQLAEAKTKTEAQKMLKKLQKDVETEKIANEKKKKRAATPDAKKKKKLEESFIIGEDTGDPLTSGFFQEVTKLQKETIDFVEIDPPYAIDLQNNKKGDGFLTDDYSEIDPEIYAEFMEKTFSECHRVMKKNSWMVCWFGPEPWWDTVLGLMRQVGFEVKGIPGIWYKGHGQTQQPNYYLGNSYEMFFYARKGKPSIQDQGRANVYNYAPIPPQQKTHSTERPIEMIQDVIQTFCPIDGRVLTPFAGSGNTILAANNLDLDAIGYELHQKHQNEFVVKVHNGTPHEYTSR